MRNGYIESEVVVHPAGGMQLSEGYIRKNDDKRFVGSLPGMLPCIGDTMEEVLRRLDIRAKSYYGDDVVVEITSQITIQR